MSFLFPLGDIAPPAPANTFFPEQATVSNPGTPDLDGSVIFPQLFAALSEADVRPPSPDRTDVMAPAVAEMAPLALLPRPAVKSGRYDDAGHRVKANDDQNDPAICSTRHILPWAGSCHGMEVEFAPSLSLSFPPSQPEHGEEVVYEDSSLPDSQFVTSPALFFPLDPLPEKPPVSADAFVKDWIVEEEPLKGDGLQHAVATSTLPATDSEDAIPVRDGTERSVAEESLPPVPRQESSMSILPLPGAAENLTQDSTPGREPVSSSLKSVSSFEDARGQIHDDPQPDPAIPKVSVSDRAEPVTREAFRILMRENTAPIVDSRAAATTLFVPEATRQAVTFASSEQTSQGVVPLSPAPPKESPTETGPARSRPFARSQQSIPDTTPFSKTPAPSVKPTVPGFAEAPEKTVELSVRGSQGGSTHNGETKRNEQPNGTGEKPEAGGRPALSREQWALLANSRPTVEPINMKPESGHAAPTAGVEEPIGVHAGQNPVRQLRVSLPPSEAGGDVQLLVQQRPGGVEVSVHSSNQSLRETLRSSLSELIGSLDRKGIASEALPSIPAVSASFGERLDSAGPSTTTETPEGDRAKDPQNKQDRPPQWESGGDNRRRRNPDADAWKKYLEEYAWRNQ